MPILIFALAFVVAYYALDAIVPHDVRFNRVGGLLHWRLGRIGGSFYIARRAR